MDKLFAILEKLVPVQLAALIVIFIYFLKVFKDISGDFVKLAQQQTEYLRQRFETVDKATNIFERTVNHQEKDLKRLYELNDQLKQELEKKKKEGVERLDQQLEDIVNSIEEIRQERISKEELEKLTREISKAKTEATNSYSTLINSLSLNNAQLDDKLHNKIFVVMPYTEQANKRYEILKNAVQEIGFELFRADELMIGGVDVGSHVRQCISEADIILVDISENNPSVMYELGYAHAIAKPVILLATEKSNIPFDIANYRIILFDDSIKGIELLKDRISSTMKEVKERYKNKKISNWVQAFTEVLPGSDLIKTMIRILG